MRWYDKPQQVWWYRWLFHAWLTSWNVNDALYPVSRRVRVTRSLLFDQRGRSSSGATIGFLLTMFLLVIGLWVVWQTLQTLWRFVT